MKNNTIGKRIAEARINRNITQEHLEELSGLSVSTISRIETGKYMPTIENLLKLSEILDVGLDYFLYDLLPHNKDILLILPHLYIIFRRLRNATSRINTAFFVTYKQITPHRIWYNRVD